MIGIFDSGIGGLSVFKELVRLMPGEDYDRECFLCKADFNKSIRKITKLLINRLEMSMMESAITRPVIDMNLVSKVKSFNRKSKQRLDVGRILCLTLLRNGSV